MVRINKTQSKHVDADQREVAKLFESERALVQKRQNKYFGRMDECIEAIKAELTNLIGINWVNQIKHRGGEKEQQDLEKYKSLMALVEDLSKAAVSFGQQFEKVNCFEEIRFLWNEGAISKQQYVNRFLQDNKDWSVSRALEYADLSFGVGHEGAIEFGKGIPAPTKKAYRKKLQARVASRKIKK